MGIQNNVNAMLGTVAAAATMGKHIENQNKEVAVKKIEAEKEEYNATNKLKDFDSKIIDEEIAKNGYDTEVDPEKILSNRFNKAQEDFNQAQNEKIFADMPGSGVSKRKLNRINKNLEMAGKAFEEVNSLIEARENLKFDKNIARKKIEVLGGNK